jgi:FkbM family methyltransferase
MQLIDNRENTKEKAKDFINSLNHDIYLVGRNKYSISLTNWLKSLNKNVAGYIDDYTEFDSYNNLPIFKSNSVNYSESAIINCVVEGSCVNTQRFINVLGSELISNYFELQYTFNSNLIPIEHMGNTDDIQFFQNTYHEIGEKLIDDTSKREFWAVLNFRFNRDFSFMFDFNMNFEGQYFEQFIDYSKLHFFVDGGGYDGLTSANFIKKSPSYKAIYYFEPFLDSMNLSREKLKMYDNIRYFQFGLWNENETLNFKSNLGNANKISSEGDISINVVKLSDCSIEKVDFIKLDIEGAELNAIEGAKELIMKWKPILAICVYHNQSDFTEIPKSVLTINDSYKMYFRHYTQGVCESVMYFV